MAATTIASSIDHSVTLGSGTYISPLKITSSGTIDGSAGAASAVDIPLLLAPAVLDNAGVILGATGSVTGMVGHVGADGIDVADRGKISNSGSVTGGDGGIGEIFKGVSSSGNGGIGIQITAAGVNLDNSGIILGGAGGYVGEQFSHSLTNGSGGYGVELGSGDHFNNTGTVTGGAGGAAAPIIPIGVAIAGEGGAGIRDKGGKLSNSGTILGGAGGEGGAGVDISGAGANGSNSGQITGGVDLSGLYSGGFGLVATDGAVFRNTGIILGGINRAGATVTQATLVNDGLIQASSDFRMGEDPRGAPAGVYFYSGRFVNNGTVIACNGTVQTSVSSNVFGGDGVYAEQGLTNHGLIIGGNGGGGLGGAGLSDIVGIYLNFGRVINTGTVMGGYGGSAMGLPSYGQPLAGFGGLGANLEFGSLLNTGLIAGGNGGRNANYGGGGGGTGLVGASIYITNRGTLAGGDGNLGGIEAGGGGSGDGVFLFSSNLDNAGVVAGGNGGAVGTDMLASATGAFGGLGAYLMTGTLENTGIVLGGSGGAGGAHTGGAGGDGVHAFSNSVIINRGVITGGAGGSGATAGVGGIGVELSIGTLDNAGTISGGLGANGEMGDAVYLGGIYTTLVVERGAVFNGQVVSNSYYPSTLELSGRSAAALTGIGTQFIGFNTLAFAEGAAWTLSGVSAGLAHGQEITGFTKSDAVILLDAAASNGSVTVATAGTVTIDAGGVSYALMIADATKGETDFQFLNDTLTRTGSQAMSFLAPAQVKAAFTIANHAKLFAPPQFGNPTPNPLLDAVVPPSFTLSATALPGSAAHLFHAGHDPVGPLFILHG